MPVRFFTGSKGHVIADGQTLPVLSWEATPTCDLQEKTHSGTAGYKTFNAGNLGMTGTVSMNWDADANPMEDPPDLIPGSSITLDLYLEGAGTPFFNIAEAFIRETPVVVANGQNVTFTVQFTVSGEWVNPIGDF